MPEDTSHLAGGRGAQATHSRALARRGRLHRIETSASRAALAAPQGVVKARAAHARGVLQSQHRLRRGGDYTISVGLGDLWAWRRAKAHPILGTLISINPAFRAV